MVSVFGKKSVYDEQFGRETTSIEIKKSTWFRLHKRKGFGESFDTVINKIIDEVEEK